MIKETIINYIFSRLQEVSTVRGLVAFFGGMAGYSFSQDTSENLVYIILGVIGLIGALLPDIIKKKEKISDVPESIPDEKIISSPATAKSYSIGSSRMQSNNSKFPTSSNELSTRSSNGGNQETADAREFSGFNDK